MALDFNQIMSAFFPSVAFIAQTVQMNRSGNLWYNHNESRYSSIHVIHLLLFVANVFFLIYQIYEKYSIMYYTMLVFTGIVQVWGLFLLNRSTMSKENEQKYSSIIIGTIVLFVIVTYSIGFFAPAGYGFKCSDTKHDLLAILYINLYSIWNLFVILFICRQNKNKVQNNSIDQGQNRPLPLTESMTEMDVKTIDATETFSKEKTESELLEEAKADKAMRMQAMIVSQRKSFLNHTIGVWFFSSLALTLINLSKFDNSSKPAFVCNGYYITPATGADVPGWVGIVKVLTLVIVALPINLFITVFYTIPLKSGYFELSDEGK